MKITQDLPRKGEGRPMLAQSDSNHQSLYRSTPYVMECQPPHVKQPAKSPCNGVEVSVLIVIVKGIAMRPTYS
jgi:hypothetical protein